MEKIATPKWSVRLSLGMLIATAVAFVAGGSVAYLALSCRLQLRCEAQLEQQRQAQAHAAAEQKRQVLWRFNVESNLYFNAMDEARTPGCNGAANTNPQAARWRRDRQAQLDWVLTELGARFQQSQDITQTVNEMRERLTDVSCDQKAQKQDLDQLKLKLTAQAAKLAYDAPARP